MAKYLELEIDNSAASAIKTGKWNAPGAAFYDQLLNSFHYGGKIPEDAEELNKCIREGKYRTWVQYLEEAYLIAPVKKIHNDPHGVTPFSRSGCKYPHHVIKGNKLVLSVPGIKAAYSRALQMGVLKGDVKKHLERHIQELGMQVNFKNGALSWNEACEIQIEENFHDIYSTIMEHTGINLFESEEYFDEASHGNLKVDHRLAIDLTTGHNIHIIYSLDGIILTKNNVVGGKEGRHDEGMGKTDKAEIKLLKRYGNTDHESYNQKVLAIIDMETGEHLDRVKCKGPFGDDSYNKNTSIELQVGQVDMTPSFKSTFWNRNNKFNTINRVSDREGERLRGVMGAVYDTFGHGRGSYAKAMKEFVDDLKRTVATLKDPQGRIDQLRRSIKMHKDGHPELAPIIIRPNANTGSIYDAMEYATAFMSMDDLETALKEMEFAVKAGRYNSPNREKRIKALEKQIKDTEGRIISAKRYAKKRQVPWRSGANPKAAYSSESASEDSGFILVDPDDTDQVTRMQSEGYVWANWKNRGRMQPMVLAESVIEGPPGKPVLTSEFNDEVESTTAEDLWNWMHANIQYDKSLGDWKLRSAAELYMDKKGNCHDQSYFTAFILNSWGYDARQLFFVEFSDDSEIGGNSHTLCYFRKREDGAAWYWFENAWEDQAGIHGPYMDLEEVKRAVMEVYKNDDDINSHKFDGIVFGSVAKYRLGMNLHDYVESWELDDDRRFADMNKDKIQEAMELLDWITEAATNTEHQETMSDVLKKCKTPQELLNWMDCIEYGWIDKAGNKNGTGESDDTSKMWAEYKLQSPLQLIRSKVGVCWDQCELERVWFERHKFPFTIVYLEIDDDEAKPSHTFLVYKEPGETSEVYWFEHSWGQKKGIHKFSDFGTCMQTIIQQFEISQGKKHGQNPVYKHMIFPAPKYGINVIKYMEYAHKCREVDIGDIQYDDIFGESVEPLNENFTKDIFKLPDGYGPYTLQTLPQYMYHGSPSSIKTLKGKNLFLTPHVGIACCFIQHAMEPIADAFRKKYGKDPVRIGFNSGYDAWNYEDQDLQRPLKTVKITHNIKEMDEVITGTTVGYIHVVDINKIRDKLKVNPSTKDPDREVIYNGPDLPSEKIVPVRLKYEIRYDPENERHHGKGIIESADRFSYQELIDQKLIDNPRYDPPLPVEELPEELKEDPVHLWRARTGIELIHREPTLGELERIWRNWNLMSIRNQETSDRKSIEFFGMDNSTHYYYLRPQYATQTRSPYFANPSMTGDNVEKFTEDGAPPAMEDPSAETAPSEQEPQQEESKPKKADRVESPKNGVRRKKLYIAFIEWCKEYNDKNAFGSIFDEDAFKVSYPFVPEEMRYFYRLANPMLCVLSGDMTFFPVAELRKLNAQNSDISNQLIFAATPNDVRVFNCRDKKVYRGTYENGALKLNEVLSDTFDTYIQNMIKKGDILTAPLNDE